MMYEVTPSDAGEAIYDFGANNGDDIAYYLTKGRRVVAVEANPGLASRCEERFRTEIDRGSLVVLNCALAESSDPARIPFFIHKTNHVLSQASAPPAELAEHFEVVEVPARRASDIIRAYGAPHYVKVDLEGADLTVLRDILAHGPAPRFVSVEAHSVHVFCALVTGGYARFNLVDGASVPKTYVNATIATAAGPASYSFPVHSAGPFGADLVSPWLDANSMFYLLAAERLGWKDIHATNESVGLDLIGNQEFTRPLSLGQHLRDLAPSLARSLRFRLESRR